MSQRSKLEKRVNEILDKQVSGQIYGSPDAPNLLAGGALEQASQALHSSGSGALADFLKSLARGVPLPILLAKLRFSGKGGCYDKSCGGMLEEGGMIGEKQRDGLKVYQEFMREHKAAGMSHKKALEMWRAEKCNGSICKDKPRTTAKISIKKPKIKVSMKLPPPPKEFLSDDFSDSDHYSECMKLLGMPPPSEQTNDTKMAEEIGEQMSSGLAEDDQEADWNPAAMGMGRKRRGPLSDAHREKLMTGQQQYRNFMKVMKEKGISHKDALQLHRELKEKYGGKWYNDFARGFMMPIKAVAKILPHVLPFVL